MKIKLRLIVVIIFCLSVALKPKPVTIFLAGDSLMADKALQRYPLTGWGQVFGHFFDQNVIIKNKAVDGATTRSFVQDNHWKAVADTLDKGDYVFIAFGHNDEKIQLPSIGVSLPDYKNYLVQMINETRAKQAIPVLLTQASRRSFEKGIFHDTHGAYADAVREIAAQQHVALIDLQQKTEELVSNLGDEPSKKLYNWVDSAATPAYPKGSMDNTHLSITGAYEVCAITARSIKEQHLPVARYLVNIEQVKKLASAAPGFLPDPLHPDYSSDTLKKWEQKFNDFRFKAFQNSEHILPYRLHQPANIERGEKYPLVLFFHGAGERGLDNRLQLMRFTTIPFWNDYACYILAPQCPPKPPGGPDGDDVWVQTNFGASSHHMLNKPSWPMAMAVQLLHQFITDNIRHIDTNRIYVTGLSMGGFATWEILQRECSKFAAAMPVCGGADLNYAPQLTHTALWVFHGAADSTVPVKRSRDMVNAITAAGGYPKYTEFPGVGHGAWAYTYSDPKVWAWLFAQKK